MEEGVQVVWDIDRLLGLLVPLRRHPPKCCLPPIRERLLLLRPWNLPIGEGFFAAHQLIYVTVVVLSENTVTW